MMPCRLNEVGAALRSARIVAVAVAIASLVALWLPACAPAPAPPVGQEGSGGEGGEGTGGGAGLRLANAARERGVPTRIVFHVIDPNDSDQCTQYSRFSEKVLGEIEKAGLEYIVGVRMRKLSAAGEVLSRAGRHREVAPNLKVKEVPHEGRRYVVCLNPEEARRDAKVREEALAKLREKLRSGGAKRLIGNSALRRYLKLSGADVSVDVDAVAAEAQKSLWRVERAFRELESGLDLRPVYHWTRKGIGGH